ncbi:serine/threonine-protein kinase nekl-3-like, partial [Dendronephthya gigantea]|uniref:serine/threonine-protein kinase nekl-3-like n=1 Tax=Dendronephthya gigantea TaxID=151771 RepID=UPI00106B0358
MSLFGGFTPRAQAVENVSTSAAFEDVNFPSFSFRALLNKDEIGRGGFSSVFTAELPQSREKVAVKKFLGSDQIDAKILLKEAKLLNSLRHPNIVGFKGIYKDNYALLLEFVQFDFKPFGIDLQVSSLAELLCHFDKSDCKHVSEKVFNRAVEDVALGVQYLHVKGLAHRDLKPANVLVSNQHYSGMTDQNDIEGESLTSPLVCKLTDFGNIKSAVVCLEKMMECRSKPIPQEKYSRKQSEEWKELLEIYKSCTVFEQTDRPNIEDIVQRLHLRKSPLNAKRSSEDASGSDGEIHLK